MALFRFFKSALSLGRRSPAAQPPAGPQLEMNALIEAHLDGDPKAFAQIVSRYQVRLLNFVYRMIGDRERAEDLVQEAFLRVYRHLERFDRSRKFSTWIYTIASNLAKNELRNRSRSPLVTFEQARPRDDDEQIEPLPAQIELAGLQARDVEDRLDQAGEPLTLGAQDLECALAGRWQEVRVLGHDLEGAVDVRR